MIGQHGMSSSRQAGSVTMAEQPSLTIIAEADQQTDDGADSDKQHKHGGRPGGG